MLIGKVKNMIFIIEQSFCISNILDISKTSESGNHRIMVNKISCSIFLSITEAL